VLLTWIYGARRGRGWVRGGDEAFVPIQCSVTFPLKVSKLDSLVMETTDATIHHTNRISGNCAHARRPRRREMKRSSSHLLSLGRCLPYT